MVLTVTILLPDYIQDWFLSMEKNVFVVVDHVDHLIHILVLHSNDLVVTCLVVEGIRSVTEVVQNVCWSQVDRPTGIVP